MALHVTTPHAEVPTPGPGGIQQPSAHKREPLPPGVLPGITDTDPPPLNPATIIENGRVWVDESKLHPQPHHTSHGSAPAAH